MSTRLKEKSGVYFLFSRLFREAPDSLVLHKIVEKKLLTFSHYFFEEHEQLTEGILEEIDWKTKVENIAVEYTALFVAPGDHAICPYGSFYCDSIVIDTSTADSCYFPSESIRDWGIKGLIAGPSSNVVKRAYFEQGYRIDIGGYRLPDHIACELEFVGRMYQEGKIDVVQAFLRNFFAPWIFLFLDKVKQQNYSDFYQKVAFSLEKFMQEEFRDVFPLENIATSGCEKP